MLLHTVEISKPSLLCNAAASCFVLHNFCLAHGETSPLRKTCDYDENPNRGQARHSNIQHVDSVTEARRERDAVAAHLHARFGAP